MFLGNSFHVFKYVRILPHNSTNLSLLQKSTTSNEKCILFTFVGFTKFHYFAFNLQNWQNKFHSNIVLLDSKA